MIAIVAARLLIRESRDPSADQRLDIPGLLTSAVALFALTFALIEANENCNWTSPTILSLFAVAGIGMVAFVLLELHQRAPMLDLSLFRNGTFAGANIVALLVFLPCSACSSSSRSTSRASSAIRRLQAGAMFLPMTMLIMFVAPVAGKAVRPSRLTLAHRRRMLLLTAHLFWLSTLKVDSNFWDILPALILGGLGMSLTMTPATAAAIGSVPVAKAGVARVC